MRRMKDGTKGAGTGAVIAALLVGLVAGAVLVGLLRGEPDGEAASRGAEVPALASPEVAREIQALTAEVAGLRLAVERQPRASLAADEAAPMPGRAEPSSAGALSALADAVSQLAGRLGSTPAAAPLSPPDESTPQQRDEVFKLLDLDRDLRRRQHLLWSMDRVLKTYGTPDSIESNDATERWIWSFGTKERPRFLSVTFRDGHVISVN